MKNWKVWTAFLAVFAAGIVVGVAGLGITLKLRFAPPRDPKEFHQHMRQRMLDDFIRTVQPDPASVPAIKAALDRVFQELETIREDTEPRIRAVLKGGEQQIKKHLTEEQAARFDRMIRERRERGPGMLMPPPPPPPKP